jgi:predicted phage terminase large subunit-like protein
MNATLDSVLRGDLLSFARKALRGVEGVRLGREPYLHYLAYELALFAEEDTNRLLINLPPGHLKTSLGSVCLTAWLLARDPTLKIIIVSHAEHLSKAIARKIRSIMQFAWFVDLFATRIKKGHAEVTDFGTASGGGVFVTSFHAGFTGRRADVIIVDDPHDISDENKQIEATIEAFNTTLLSRLNDRKNGRVLVIAHRVHEQDLSAHLIGRRMWKHVALPLIAINDQTYRTTKGLWHRKRGELLRPGSFSPEDLDDLRDSSFNPDFGLLYQQDIESQGLPAFRADHFPAFSDTLLIPGPVVLSVDAGISDRRTSAFSVVQAWRFAGDCFFLLDQFREQTDFTGVREALGFFIRRFRPVAILIERAANGHALISELTRKHPKLVRPIDPDGRSKSARLRPHALTILSRRVRLSASAPWREAFVREFCEFPKGKFSDQVDATTQLLDHATELVDVTSFSSGERAIAATGTGRTVSFKPTQGGERGIVGAARYGRPAGSASAHGPIISIKTEVKY